MKVPLSSQRGEVLRGSLVTLEPMALGHLDALLAVGLDPAIWEWSPFPMETPGQMRAYVEDALAGAEGGSVLPFVTRCAESGAVVGSTRFANVEPRDLRAEIGWTWLARDHWRTGKNVEAKLLMLKFAFETLGLRRVELKTDSRNDRSRRAMEGLGASFEGIFRKHIVTAGGGVRHSAYYSILDEEWAGVREGLRGKLARFA